MSGLRTFVPDPVKDLLRPLAQRIGLAASSPWPLRRRRPPWSYATAPPLGRAVHWCNLCRWTGVTFHGESHVESALCPRCGSIARDRFMFAALVHSGLLHTDTKVLEMSPRLGEDYRAMMRRWCAYRSSDFDLRGHRADLVLDLQNLTLPDASVDVLISAHVLEHVPDTATALANVHRLLSPGGTMFLQVPVVQGRTSRPDVPEFHNDRTEVFWHFGWDLAATLRDTGFRVTTFVTEEFRSLLAGDDRTLHTRAGGFDVPSMVEACPVSELSVLLRTTMARQLGIEPSYQFVVWRCDRR